MRVFVAGGSGVMGVRLVPLLVAAGHQVAAMTRTTAKVEAIRAGGAEPVVCDAFDGPGVLAALAAFRPDAVVHQLTDLPDDAADLGTARGANAAIREVGTDHLVAAATAVGADHLVVQSIAWLTDGQRPPSVVHLERRARAAGGVVLRYGQWYGPGTYHEGARPAPPRVGIDAAARATLDALTLPAGTYVVTDDGIAPVADT
jgi:nucleoside-diphosphate-sugar epimerase